MRRETVMLSVMITSLLVAGTKAEAYTKKTLEKENLNENGYYYNQLNTSQKQLYATLDSEYAFDMNTGQCNTEELEVDLQDFTKEDFYHVGSAYLKDNPEVFYIRDFTLSCTNNQWKVVPQTAYPETSYQADALEYRGNWNDVIHVLHINEDHEPVEIVKTIYDYVIKNYSYTNTSNIIGNQSTNETRAVGYMLNHHKGCCESYSKLIQILCNYYGIECITVTGTDHMWNEVNIEGKWYLLDVTYEIGKHEYNHNILRDDNIYYDYFLLGNNDEEHRVINATYQNDTGGFISSFGWFEAPALCGFNYKERFITVGNENNAITYRVKNEYEASVYEVSGDILSANILNTVSSLGYEYDVTSIDANAFEDCDRIKSVVIPPLIKSIGNKAFYDCKNLKSITIRSKQLHKVGKTAIKGISRNAKIKVSKQKKQSYIKLFNAKTGFKKGMQIAA